MKKTMLMITIAAIMAACNNDKKTGDAGMEKQSSMSSTVNKQERNKKVIAASMDAFARRDIDAMLRDAAPGYTDYGDGTTPPIKNNDSAKAFIKMLVNSIENYRANNVQLIADGDDVFYFADWSGTFKNNLMYLKATGKALNYKDCDMFKLNEEGKVTEHRSIQHMATLLMASGTMK